MPPDERRDRTGLHASRRAAIAGIVATSGVGCLGVGRDDRPTSGRSVTDDRTTRAESADTPRGTPIGTTSLQDRQAVPWGVRRIGARTAHRAGHRGAGTHVAVIDTGIAPEHPDLTDLGEGTTLVEGTDSWGAPRDHGTHVAGVVGARDNAYGVVGVAPAATVHAVRVFDRAGTGDVDRVAAGLRWAAEREMDVATVSISTRIPSEELAASARAAADAGVVVVAATAPEDVDRAGYPAAYDSVIAVGATTPDGSLAEFSRDTGVDLFAPGVRVTATVPGGYGPRRGTSVACPHVAGAAALVRATGRSRRETIEWLRANARGTNPVVSLDGLG